MLKAKIRIGYLQMDIAWHDAPLNLARIEDALSREKAHLDLFILPEMFTSGFTMEPQEIAQAMNGHAIHWMLQLAEKWNFTVLGSLVINDQDAYTNRLVVVKPDSTIFYYDKRHLYTFAGEDRHFSKGRQQLVFDLSGWRIMPLICYDLRFPVWSFNTFNYNVLVYVANWPDARIEAWRTLLSARAIENQAYVIGVNRIGIDANEYNYPGHSGIYDFTGKCLYESDSSMDFCQFEIDIEKQKAFRRTYNFLKDQERFIIEQEQ